MREVEEFTETLLPAAEQVLRELEEEARANWEERAIHQATQVTNLAGEAFETLSENRWSRRDCLEYQEELDWAMRTFRRICNEIETASMSAKMRRTARVRLDQVNSEYQRATRVVERLLQAHRGEYRGEQKRRDNFRTGRAPDSGCEDSIPMERRPTLPVSEVLEAERRELSWDNMAVPGGWSQPSVADQGRGVGDLGMAGLNIGAPARLQRGGRVLPPTDASTPLGRDSGELPRACSGPSARADYRLRLELNAQDSDEDVFFQRAGAGENRRSPPERQQDESEYATAYEAGSERGRRRYRDHQDDRPSAGRDEAGRSFDRGDRRPAGCRGEDPDPPVGPPPRQSQGASQAAEPVLGLGLEAIQGMTNAMNAIANQVFRSSGGSGRNAGWPYFDGTFRDYPAFKRKFESFRMTYHRGTPTRELFQQFREMCLPEKLSIKIKSADTMENAWIRLDAWFRDKNLFIKDLMQDIKGVAPIKDSDDERLMDYYVTLQAHIEEAQSAGALDMLLISANVELMVLPLTAWEKRIWREAQGKLAAEDRSWYMNRFVNERLRYAINMVATSERHVLPKATPYYRSQR